MDKLELTEDGHIVCGKDDEGYPIIVGSVIWNDVARRKSHRMQVVPFQGFTTIGKTHAFSIIRKVIAASNTEILTQAQLALEEMIDNFAGDHDRGDSDCDLCWTVNKAKAAIAAMRDLEGESK